ncbi:MAG: hypothetical protein DWQ11_07830 [Proteobacteria bacterium]|nr:MAG: hypothetical protein DWQ11_07830 [Pseudomonadota bacterium]
MRHLAPCLILCSSLAALPVLGAPTTLSAADQAAAFKAAGFTQRGGQWRSGCDDPGTPSYTPGQIEQVRDLNGDGRPEALITEGGTYCYGMSGSGFSLVSQQADGQWRLMTTATGLAGFLPTRGAGGWPDIEVGGPGFCFPVMRWNGKAYALHRHEYEGQRCKMRR